MHAADFLNKNPGKVMIKQMDRKEVNCGGVGSSNLKRRSTVYSGNEKG